MKKNISYALTVILPAIAVLFTSCNKNQSDPIPLNPVQIKLSANQVSMVESGNAFAFDIFRKVSVSEGNSGNTIISPLSISSALSMTLNGASGDTRTAMIDALRLTSLTPDIINGAYKDLSTSLLNVDKRVLISISNSVWTEKNFVVKKPFTDILGTYYDAESVSFDVTDQNAPKAINNWIDSKTNGLIKNMVGPLDANTVMLLINAIYFKGKWNPQFDKSKTVQQFFYYPDGSEKEVPMMKQKADFKVYTGTSFVMAEFPYGQGNFVMDVLLPNDRNGADAIIAQLNDSDFKTWTGQMFSRETTLSFPRFKYGFKNELKNILSDMGMGIAFSENADFSNISDLDLLISKVLHQAFIETNEEGTEAAAATVVVVGTTSAGPTDPLVFTMDHPFIYIIREKTTNAILFMGKVADPLAS